MLFDLAAFGYDGDLECPRNPSERHIIGPTPVPGECIETAITVLSDKIIETRGDYHKPLAFATRFPSFVLTIPLLSLK